MKIQDIQIGDLYYQKWQSKPGEWWLITGVRREKKTTVYAPTWWWTAYSLTDLRVSVVIHGTPEWEIEGVTALGRIRSIWRAGEKLL